MHAWRVLQMAQCSALTVLRSVPHGRQNTLMKTWRIREARDFIILTSHILSRSNATFIVFNQDDGVWEDSPWPDLHVRPSIEATRRAET